MSSKKCPRCGMVNWTQAAACQRCDAALDSVFLDSASEAPDEQRSGPPSLLKRASLVVGLVALFIFGSYISLRATSDAATFEQRQIIARALDVLEGKTSGERVFLLRHLTAYRTSDNWWNRVVGHRDAYAATNFPFEVVTLYPDFFKVPIDDTERAIVLLHESYHLAGAGEEKAFAEVWREKGRLGWTKERYGQTPLWRGVRAFTVLHAPQLFRCGSGGAEDCFE